MSIITAIRVLVDVIPLATVAAAVTVVLPPRLIVVVAPSVAAPVVAVARGGDGYMVSDKMHVHAIPCLFFYNPFLCLTCVVLLKDPPPATPNPPKNPSTSPCASSPPNCAVG